MAITNASNSVTFRAAGAYSQYSVVYQSSGAYVTLLSSTATSGVYFIQNATTAEGDLVECAGQVGMETYAISGSTTIVVNSPLSVSTTTSGAVAVALSTEIVIAHAREASAAVGDIIRVQIADYQKK